MNKRKLKNEIQSPRNKLLYLIYSAPKSRIRDEPGVRAKICRALDFSSDGLFYYHLKYLTESGLIEQQGGYIRITEEGEQEFEAAESLFAFGIIAIAMGITFFSLLILVKMGYLSISSIVGIGFVIVIVGVISYWKAKESRPKLPREARIFLEEIKKRQ